MSQQQGGKWRFDRAVCLGDIVTVIAVVGGVFSGIWFAAAQSQKLDTVVTVVNSVQQDVTNIKVDVGALKAQVKDVQLSERK